MNYKRLGSIATIKFCSVTPSRAKPSNVPAKWLVCANFMADNEVDFSPTANFVMPDEEWLLNQNDIVIKRISPAYVNYIDFNPDGVYCGNNLIIVTPGKEVEAKYLAMILNEKIGELSRDSSIGAVMKSISRNDLELLEIPFPEKGKQQLIGNLWLKSIELKKKRIKLAELENTKVKCIIQNNIIASGGINNV